MYECLSDKAAHLGICVMEQPMPERLKGLYGDNVIWINKNLTTSTEKYCVLAEEIGHHYTTAGDILDQAKLDNRKQELRARSWAYEYLVPLHRIVEAHRQGIANQHDLAEWLHVTETFLVAAIQRYQEKYGISRKVGRHTVYFEPLNVVEG